MLNQQLNVINSDFARFGISFSLQGVTRTVHSTWSTDRNELQMKQSLRRGDYRTLNLYFLRSVSGNLGYCYFPTYASPGSTAFVRDGCTVLFSSVPGGSSTNFNLGKTATHEIGHWLNLYHTFQGGCTGSGDLVADTPAQASPSSGCPHGRDSCPSQPGLDPIHNYMDYSNDACYTEFTEGQRVRMHNAWNTFRA
ncbi:zincin [Sodiomyces alkalinus F11]|uniref:Zincin n=1 Tax=Sodiomyces alkalinus (strain CBS 110278 / VKM F-3762 / F11) TaxID=1314773 RepID=A0A3N2PKM9_SODAK|nr:zincin [Sodiomyces alkalinus F11]ROT35078.1 zincin [Sodiomyces alkalinus F11]